MLKILLVYDDFQELTNVDLMLKKIGFDVLGITSEFSLAEQLLAFNPQVVVAQGQGTKVSSAGVGRRLRESLRWDGKTILIFYPSSKPQPADILKMRMDVGLEYPVEPAKLVQVLAQLAGLDTNQLLDKLIKNMSQDVRESSNPLADRTASLRDEALYVSGRPEESQNEQRLKDTQVDSIESSFNATGNHDSDLEKEFLAYLNQNKNPTFPLNPEDKGASAEPSAMESDPFMKELEELLQKTKTRSLAPPAINDPLRAEKYAQFLGKTPPLNLSSIKRREAKSRMRDMVKNISKESMRDQDDLRREFVKALFKRKG